MRSLARGLMYLGIVATVVVLSKVHAAYVAANVYDYTNSARFSWSIAYMVVLAVSAYAAGLPDVPRSRRGALTSALAATAGAAVGISLIQLAAGNALLPRFVVLGSALVLFPWYLVCEAIARGGRARAEDRERVVLVGSAAEADALIADLAQRAERPAALVAHLEVADASPGPDGTLPLQERVREQSATVVVLNRQAQDCEVIVHQAARLHEDGTRVRTLSLFYEEWLGKLPLSELERVSLMFDIGEVHRLRYGRIKRGTDVGLALVGCVALVIAIPFVVIGNLVANRGSLFYQQPRVGKSGNVFQILKFRTMRQVDDDEPTNWTAEDDPRVTKLGRLLRASHLDELPQVVNILRGDLSMVGPRPEQPHYVEDLTEKLPFYDLRHLVRPGLTGWAQVNYGYAGDDTDALEKLQYDFFYLRHQSLAFDLRILGRTLRSVAGGSGR